MALPTYFMNRDSWNRKSLGKIPHIYVFELENNHKNIIVDYDGHYGDMAKKIKKHSSSTLSPDFLLSILLIVLLGLVTGSLLYKVWVSL